MSLLVASSRVFMAQFFFLNLQSFLKKLRLWMMMACSGLLHSPVVFCISCWVVLVSDTLPAASLRSWSHHSLALVEGLLSLPVVAIAFCIALDRILAYLSS